jgi:hypothetical protein
MLECKILSKNAHRTVDGVAPNVVAEDLAAREGRAPYRGVVPNRTAVASGTWLLEREEHHTVVSFPTVLQLLAGPGC